MTPLPPFCLTGASGFIGQRLCARLASLGATDVTILARTPGRVARPSGTAWRVVRADVAEPLPADALPAGCSVIHLASATGSASPDKMRRVNVEGTRNVLAAAERAKARHLLHVSSVAAAFRDKRWAPYAASKAAAEALLTRGATPYTLVRPTIVFGPGSPNQAALEKLATLALPLLPGEGEVRVQPIHVDDLVDALIYLALHPPVAAVPLTIGGPTQLSLRDLFAAIRRARGLMAREPLRLPLAPLRRLLMILGAATGSRFPVSAGQFVAFANDSIADVPAGGLQLPAPRISLERMLQPGADA